MLVVMLLSSGVLLSAPLWGRAVIVTRSARASKPAYGIVRLVFCGRERRRGGDHTGLAQRGAYSRLRGFSEVYG